jgi:hypothetical protein
VTIAAYNGGWEAGAAIPTPGVPNSYRQTLAYTMQGAGLSVRALAVDAGNMAFGSYEAGPGYLLNGLNGATVSAAQKSGQERVMKSVAAGVATLDVFLQNAAQGMVTQNYFTFQEGTEWTSHARWSRGGAAFPAWRLLSLFNNEAAGGDLLDSRVLWRPTDDLPEVRNPVTNDLVYPAIPGASMVAVYAFRRADRLALFLINRSLPWSSLSPDDPLFREGDDGRATMWLKLPIRSAASLKLMRLNQSYDRHNVDLPGTDELAAVIDVETIPLAVPQRPSEIVLDETMGAAGGLPPASAYLYVFEGVS